jgi:cytochrome c556
MERRNQIVGGRWSEQVRGAGRNLTPIAALVFFGCVLFGCGGGSSPPGTGASPVNESPAHSAASRDRSAAAKVLPQNSAVEESRQTAKPQADLRPQGDEAATGVERRVAVHTDAQGRKWLGDVPYDVFFDDPLAVAAEGKPAESGADNRSAAIASAGATATGKVPNRGSTAAGVPEKGPPTSESHAPTAKHDWNRLIEMDVLDAEVKRIRNELAAQLQSVAKYNSHYQEIAVAGATLAAVAEIVGEHPGSVSWKNSASMVRDLATKIHDAASASGSPAFKAARTSYEQVVDVLDGNVPAGVAPSQPERDFAEVANRVGVMKRMDRSFQWLKKSGPAQQVLRKQAGNAIHESTLLAALSRVIAVGRYDSADDPKYKAHADELAKSAAAVAASVKSEDATAFSDAVARVQKRCDACHADFRFQ